MSRKFELTIRIGENSPLMTTKYTDIGALVRDFNDVKLSWLYEVFIEEIDDNNRPIRRLITLNNGHTSACDEWCAECDNEVVLSSRFEIQKCPECGSQILPCNLCYGIADCSKCPLTFGEFNLVELL